MSAGSENGAVAAPRVLIATGREWLSGARLALALNSFGCQVSMLSPARHPARRTGALTHWTRFRQVRPFRSLELGLDEANPDALILADEVVLHYAFLLAAKNDPHGERLRNLINGTAAGIPALDLARTRLGVLDLAHSLGVAIPPTLNVRTPANLDKAAEDLGLPMVLKSDGSSGGQGVRVVSNLTEAEGAWQALHATPGLLRVLKRGLVDKEWTHLRAWLRRQTFTVSAQKWVTGHEHTAMAVAHQGRMLASVEFEVVQALPNRGPSTVLRVIENAKISEAMRKVIAKLGINGFVGFDFMCDPLSGEPLMIEMNTRTTQLSHLSRGPGKDLVAAYVREVLGMKGAEDRPAATDSDLVALFPQELHRDAHSRWVSEAWMDVPWESPALIDFALQRGRKKIARDLLPNGLQPVASEEPQGSPMVGA